MLQNDVRQEIYLGMAALSPQIQAAIDTRRAAGKSIDSLFGDFAQTIKMPITSLSTVRRYSKQLPQNQHRGIYAIGYSVAQFEATDYNPLDTFTEPGDFVDLTISTNQNVLSYDAANLANVAGGRLREKPLGQVIYVPADLTLSAIVDFDPLVTACSRISITFRAIVFKGG